MNPLKAIFGPCGLSMLVLLLLVSYCSVLQANSLPKPATAAQFDHHHNGCEAIQRILNGTTTAGNHHSPHSDKDEGFLVDHEQWHNHHKDCEYRIMRRLFVGAKLKQDILDWINAFVRNLR